MTEYCKNSNENLSRNYLSSQKEGKIDIISKSNVVSCYRQKISYTKETYLMEKIFSKLYNPDHITEQYTRKSRK